MWFKVKMRKFLFILHEKCPDNEIALFSTLEEMKGLFITTEAAETSLKVNKIEMFVCRAQYK